MSIRRQLAVRFRHDTPFLPTSATPVSRFPSLSSTPLRSLPRLLDRPLLPLPLAKRKRRRKVVPIPQMLLPRRPVLELAPAPLDEALVHREAPRRFRLEEGVVRFRHVDAQQSDGREGPAANAARVDVRGGVVLVVSGGAVEVDGTTGERTRPAVASGGPVVKN